MPSYSERQPKSLCGDSREPSVQPIVCCIESHARRTPHQIAVITGNVEISYGELWPQITVAAAWYLDNGVRSGDTVLISTDSRDPFFTAAYFGAHLARAIAVPIGFRASPDEIEQRIRSVESQLALIGDRLSELQSLLTDSTGSVHRSRDFVTPTLSDVAEIMFTTGSTGESKGVTLSHGNIAASAELIRSFVGNTEDDIEVVTVPLTHSFGLGRLRSTMLAGGTIVFVPGLTFPQLTIRALRDHVATGLACVPAGICLLVAQYEESLVALANQLKYLEMGSAPLSIQDKNKLCRLLPDTRLCMHYGLTEASRSTFLEFHADRDHLDSVGKPSPGVEVRIFSQSEPSVPAEQMGLIHVRAATVMQGYWKDEKRTRKVLDRDSGWLNSGDLGYLDANGYVYLAGRADDQINTGGVKILPEDVERYANEFGGVQECGCIGIPDPEGLLGEVPLLFVVSGNTPLDSREFSSYLRKRFGQEMPRFVIRSIDELPRTDSGKLLRRELRTRYANEQIASE